MAARAIDARSIVTLVVFFVVNVLVIFPLKVPLPYGVGAAVRSVRGWLMGDAGVGTGTGTRVHARDRDPLELGTVLSAGETKKPSNSGPAEEEPEVNHDTRSVLTSNGKRMQLVLGLASAPVAGVLLLLASTCIPGSVVRGGIVGNGGVRPYDIMTLFLSFAYISLSLDSTGLLRYLAFVVAARSSTSGRTLFSSLYALFVVLSLAVGNDPVVLSGTPFVAYFTQLANISPPTPFLFAQFQAANLASALLVSSNPTNLVLTSSFHLSFLSFSAWTALPTVAAAVALYPTLLVQFRKRIPKTLNPPKVNPRAALTDPFGAIFTATIFLTCIVVLVALSAVGLLEGVQGVWAVTAPAAILVLARDCIHDLRRTRPRHPSGGTEDHIRLRNSYHPIAIIRHRLPTVCSIISRLPLPLLPFAFSMFILVDALEYTGWVSVWANWWAAWARVGGTAGCIWLMGMLSVLGCNILGTNIGLTVLLSRILVIWRDEVAPSNRTLYGSVLSLAIGSNFGAYSFVFSASLAGLLWRGSLKQKGIFVHNLDFIKWNSLPLIITMVVGCLVVAAEVCVMY